MLATNGGNVDSLKSRIMEALVAEGSGTPSEIHQRPGVGGSKEAVTGLLETLVATHAVKRSPAGSYYVPGHVTSEAPQVVKKPHAARATAARTPATQFGLSVRIADHVVEPGRVLTNAELAEVFKCPPRGGMRRSHQTGTLLLITHAAMGHQVQPYKDRWQGDVLMYTGMGMYGNQSLAFAQNRTLAESDRNGAMCLLFESPGPNKYKFVGRVALDGRPVEEEQLDAAGDPRSVCMFPLRLTNPQAE